MALITFADLDEFKEHDFWSKRLKALRERRGEDMDGVPLFLQSKEASRLVRTARANAAMSGKALSKVDAQKATRGQQGMAANAVSRERANRMRTDAAIKRPNAPGQGPYGPSGNLPGNITAALPKAPAVQKNDLGAFQTAQGQMWRQNLMAKLRSRLMSGLGPVGKAVNSPVGRGLGAGTALVAGNEVLGDPLGGLAGMVERSVGLDGTQPGPLGISDKAAAAPSWLQSKEAAGAFRPTARNRPRPTYNPHAPKPGHTAGTAANPIPLTNPILPGSPGNPVTANVVPPSSSPRPTPRTPPRVNQQGGGMNPMTAGLLGAAAVPAMGMGMAGAAGLAHYGIDALHSGKQKLLGMMGLGGQGGQSGQGGQGDTANFLDPTAGLERDKYGIPTEQAQEIARRRLEAWREEEKLRRAMQVARFGQQYSASSAAEAPLRSHNPYFATPAPMQPTSPPAKSNL